MYFILKYKRTTIRRKTTNNDLPRHDMTLNGISYEQMYPIQQNRSQHNSRDGSVKGQGHHGE